MLSHPARYGYPQQQPSGARSVLALCALCRTPTGNTPVVTDDLRVCCSKECAAAHQAAATAHGGSGTGRAGR
jgi:hypothetical protein